MRTHVRPDGRCVVWPDGAWTPQQTAHAIRHARTHGLIVLTHLPDERTDERQILIEAGFSLARREVTVEIPLDGALETMGAARLPEGIGALSAAHADPERLRLLDDQLRDDVPGSSGWRSTPEQFVSDTFGDPAFNPATYLVAVEAATDEYVGLVRVWMNRSGPRIGMVGVRRHHRRRGITRALLAGCLRAAREAGNVTATTEFDESNDASRTLFERLGARPIGSSVELTFVP